MTITFTVGECKHVVFLCKNVEQLHVIRMCTCYIYRPDGIRNDFCIMDL